MPSIYRERDKGGRTYLLLTMMCCSRWSFFENICWQMLVTLVVFLFQVDFFVVFFEMVYLWKYLLGNVIDMRVLLQVGCLSVFSEDLSQKNIYWQIFVGLFLVMFKNLPPTTSERGKNLPPSGPGRKNPPPAGGTYLPGYKGTCLRMHPPATCGGWILKQVPKHPV